MSGITKMFVSCVCGHVHTLELNMQPPLDQMDGDLIIYAEFDKTWYKR